MNYESNHNPSSQGHTERNKKIQELGRQLVNDLHVYIKSLRLYKQDNKIFIRLLHSLESTINWIVASEGRMHFYGSNSTVYLNDRLLKLRVSSLGNVHFLLEQFETRDIGGIYIENAINTGQLSDFLQLFAPEPEFRSSANHFIQTESAAAVHHRINAQTKQKLDGAKAFKANVYQYALLLYHRLYQFIQQLYDPNQPDPDLARSERILQEFIDLIVKHDLDFLGYTNELEIHKYDFYHVCNTTIMAILFGRFLELSRLDLLELGQAAVLHNLGKLDVPPYILTKHQPLSEEERQIIRMIPVYSSRRILAGPFSWNRLRYAVIASRVNTPPVMKSGQHPNGKDESWLFSRIISICACFDSLNTRRPFRKKLHPVEALDAMKHQLRGFYDPHLLEVFTDLFRHMAVKAVHQRRDRYF